MIYNPSCNLIVSGNWFDSSTGRCRNFAGPP